MPISARRREGVEAATADLYRHQIMIAAERTRSTSQVGTECFVRQVSFTATVVTALLRRIERPRRPILCATLARLVTRIGTPVNSQASFTIYDVAFEQNCRKLSRIELKIREYSQVAAELDQEIVPEEGRVGISDPKHFAYPCFARAASQRRDNLLRSAEILRRQLEKERSGHHNFLADPLRADFTIGRSPANAGSPFP
jgi:flagellar protein FliJ